MPKERKIIIRCPKCGKRLSSPSKVMGKQGRCTKCAAYFIAPTFKMNLVRRAIQGGLTLLGIFLVVILPYRYSRAAKLAEQKAQEMTRELDSIESTIRFYEALDEDAVANLKIRLESMAPDESNETLVTRVAQVRGKFESAAEALYLKLNPPPSEDQIRIVSRAPVVTGEAKEFLEIGVVDSANAYTSGEEYGNWAKGYDTIAENKYLNCLRRKFRPKGEFEKTEDYEAEKAVWEEERSNRFVIGRRELTEKNPAQTIIVDDLKVVDIGQGFNADHNCWSHLKCLFNDDEKFRINRFCRAVSDQSVTDGKLVHRGEIDFGDIGPEWKVKSQEEFFNLPINLESGKRFRKLLNSDSVRMGLVIRFPGESRHKMPTIDEGDSKNFGRSGSRKSRVADSPFGIELRKFVVYEQDSGDIIFKRNLKKANWDRMEFRPIGR
ncbi:MAG: hypothetical protein AAF939_03195 [Planctomycetota bacterium]